jgi:mono/diheme cytochrome c family protein
MPRLWIAAFALLLPQDPPKPPKPKTDAERAREESEARKNDPLSWDHHVRALFNTHCLRCHNADKKKGNLDLAKDENPRLIAQERKAWTTALEQIESGEMPPKKERQPSEAQRKQMAAFLRKTLGSLDCDRPLDPGKPGLRRLNRTEYDNAVLDLTGLDLKLAEGFSPDPTGYGFDTISDALSVSPVLVEQTHEAARKIVAELFARKVLAAPAEREAARKTASGFASKAFRRPADPAFVESLMGLWDKARAKGETPEAAMRPVLLAVLISPRFLMRIEAPQAGATGPYPVDDYDLASRLSFFLWSAPPDAELLDCAAQGTLGKPEVLESQTRRLLKHPRSRELAENFFGQWLQLRGLAGHKPDAKAFPGFTDSLREAMGKELLLFLGEVIREDRPLTELVDADYTYVNEELARHYGIPGVKGPDLRRVTLPDRRRGGVVTSAAILMLQSDPERNNVPRRGNYVAGTILGTPPPPPPPDVPALEASQPAGQKRTLRQLLEVHRANPTCANCHAKIDPLGFGLENYDAIGRWRDRDGEAPVDASGVLPGGQAFNGPEELKTILLGRKADLTRVLTENLMIYALGRGLIREDECVVREAQKAAAASGYRFSSLVLAIVKSTAFRYRRNPEF